MYLCALMHRSNFTLIHTFSFIVVLPFRQKPRHLTIVRPFSHTPLHVHTYMPMPTSTNACVCVHAFTQLNLLLHVHISTPTSQHACAHCVHVSRCNAAYHPCNLASLPFIICAPMFVTSIQLQVVILTYILHVGTTAPGLQAWVHLFT